MKKVTLATIVAIPAVIALYFLFRKKFKTGELDWSPVNTHEENITLKELCKVKCPLDYPCIFECEGDITCALTAILCKHFDVRCDQIIQNNLETVEGTYTLFSTTSNARYITYYNPVSGTLQLTELRKQ